MLKTGGRARRALISAALLALAGTGALLAGPLDPPAGPISPTYKTLAEVEPRIAVGSTNTPGDANSLFKITQAGSYYLTGNLTGVATKHGIEIAASGVTLDLAGFELLGVPGSLDGVNASVPGTTNISVMNGSVRAWGVSGVDLVGSSGSRVAGVLASGNAGTGIRTGPGATVSQCAAGANTGHGINAGDGSTLTGCAATSNQASGFLAGNGSTLADCSASANAAHGFSGAGVVTISNCTARSNTLDGINVSVDGTLTGCSAYANAGNGIVVLVGTTVADCSARSNTLNGIRCSTGCIIRGNSSTLNGAGAGDGAGIHATGSRNRIEGNNCHSSDRGIDVDGTLNIIVRNSCSGLTLDWTIAAGNALAPIVVVSKNAAAVNGATYAGSLGSTDPNANFTLQ